MDYNWFQYLPMILTAVVAVLQAIFIHNLTTKRLTQKDINTDILFKVFAPLHKIIFYECEDDNAKLFESIDKVIQSNYTFVSPELIILFNTAKHYGEKQTIEFNKFKQAININYNYYRKVLGYPNQRIESRWSYLENGAKRYIIRLWVTRTLCVFEFFAVIYFAVSYNKFINSQYATVIDLSISFIIAATLLLAIQLIRPK